ncbi:hypothetical protein GCM10007390_17130 [Persicitalea jodogahamensis]|uniref:Uncharacterized protein n=1 Tax=Persicitalea jodogahamensis TaxID=402147 RepID=A0A8J3G9J1_9BACT|nr:hypothetical protein GCM10007390_17130 [Persicitalea jodogahamensis]
MVSQTNAIVLFITGSITVIVSAEVLLPPSGLQNRGLSILIASIIIFIFYVLWQKFVTGKTAWEIDQNEIKIVWTKKFILGDSKDTTIKWSEINDISQGAGPKYYKLQIKLATGDTMKYFHDNLTIRDDFGEMIKALCQISERRNTAN